MLAAAVPFALKHATPILATTGAVLGGKKAYEETEGDLGATALSAGLGALGMGSIPGVGRRMAGSRMGQDVSKKLIESGIAQKAGLGQQALKAAGLAGLTTAGALTIPQLASNISSGAKNIGSNVAGAGIAAQTAFFDPTTGEVVYGAPAVPNNLVSAPGTAEILDPTKYPIGSILLERQFQDNALRGVQQQAAYQLPIVDEIKRRDFQREAAGRKLAKDLQTAQSMMLQGQLGAQAMGRQSLADIGAAARSQYRYM